MEKLGRITPPHAAQNAARMIPVGKGWVMEPLETGFLLKALALGAQVRITTEEAQSLRDGQVTPENLAARHGVALPPQPPGSAVTVAFSDEAKRLAGTVREDRTAGAGPGMSDKKTGSGIPLPSPLTLAAFLAAIAILALALAT
jgi:hypothetical protein